MANKHFGQIDFEAGSEKLKLSYSSNSLCELESKLDMGVNQISELLQDKEKFKMTNLRVLFWAGLLDSKPEISEDDVKKIMSKMSSTYLIEIVSSAFAAAFPKSDGESPEKKGGNPPQSGTGEPS